MYAFLSASTKELYALRAKKQLIQFAERSNLTIATLNRQELFRLLEIAQPDDIILVEQIDRISRLNDKDWSKLKGIIKTKELRVVSLDLPTSHQLMRHSDEFTNRMLSAINDLMLDLLAAVAGKDYQDRRRRQKEGITKALSSGLYKGRKEDTGLSKKIEMLLPWPH